jgi:hypothetical protein
MRNITEIELANISGGIFVDAGFSSDQMYWMHEEAKHDGILTAAVVGVISGYVFVTHSPSYVTAAWGTAAVSAAAFMYGYETSDIWPWNY